MGPHDSVPSTVSMLFGYSAFFLPLMYIVCLICYWIVVKKRIPQRLGGVLLTATVCKGTNYNREHQGLLVSTECY